MKETNLSPLQEALFTIKKLKEALQNQKILSRPIAIIGLSCRFPNAANKIAYWQLMKQGQNAISHLPPERLELVRGTNEINLYNPSHPYWGGYISEIQKFDPYFFGISPREAILMDPQQKLLLEVTYEAIEDAGLPIDKLAGSNTGVFIGMYGSEFLKLQNLENELDALYIPTGNATSIAANRLSYQFDLRGPSIALDTACSSTLVAAHLGCTYLKNKQCDLAIVGGAKINLLPSMNDVLAQAKMLSPDGQCKTFDANANGYVQGEGIGVVILKRLEDAIQDKDRIYAVIEGSAVNQDGKTNGLTAPNGAQQEALLKAAYTVSNIDPSQVGYVECHGTGTVLGDPIELEALENVVGKTHTKEKPCWIGSVKTNIGHLEPVAGIAGLIKVALSLREGKIPPHLNFVDPNPHIPFDKYHFQVPLQVQDWPVYGDYRVGGVSSFGFGGTNSHLVVRELTLQEKPLDQSIKKNNSELFTISAKNSDALFALIDKWAIYLKANTTLDLAQLCYNLHLRRSHYPYRLAVIASTIEELYDGLCLVQKKSFENMSNIFTNLNKEVSKLNIHSDSINLQEIDLKSLANSYINNQEINWVEFENTRSFQNIDMPLYPWKNSVYWPEFTVSPSSEIQKTLPRKVFNQDSVTSNLFDGNQNILQGNKISSPLEDNIVFEFNIDPNSLPELKHTHNALHIGFYLEMLAFASQQMTSRTSFEVQNLNFLNIIYIPNEKTAKIRLILNKFPSGKFKIYKYNERSDEWTEYTNGKLIFEVPKKPRLKSLSQIKKTLNKHGTAQDFVERIKSMGMPVGDSIGWTEQFWTNKSSIISQFHEPVENKKSALFNLKIHPGIFDACIQPLFLLLDSGIKNSYLATNIKSLKYFGSTGNYEFFLYAKLSKSKTKKHFYGEWYLLDSAEQIVAACSSVELTKLGIATLDQVSEKFKPSIKQSELSAETGLNQKNKLIRLLQEVVSHIFKMPINDIATDHTLQDMGMDSLMAAAFSRQVEETLGTPLPLEELFKPVTIEEIAVLLIKDIHASSTEPKTSVTASSISQTKQMSDENLYIPYRQKRPKFKMRLFCFPYGGAGASIYRGWSQYFPDDVEICPVQYPGRETLLNEPAFSDLNELVIKLNTNLAPLLTTPFAFSGHSFGSLVAFELARFLRRNRLAQPVHLFASVFPAPQLPKPDNFLTLLKQLKQLPYDVWKTDPKNLTEQQLKETFSLITSQMDVDKNLLFSVELMRILLPAFLTDARLVENYQYHSEEPLDLPITGFYSNTDLWVPKASVEPWSIHTKKFNIYGIDGGHLFMNEEKPRKQAIKEIINNLYLPKE